MSKLKSARKAPPPTSQAEAFLQQTEDAPKSSATIGRSGEIMKYVSFKIPESKIKQMKELADFDGLNSTQYLLKLIEEDYEKKKARIDEVAKIKNRG